MCPHHIQRPTQVPSGPAALVLALSLICVPAARGVEGGLGRPISGGQINPFAGLVPPAPGFAASVGEAYYQGAIGGSTIVPIALNLAVNVDMKVSFTPISLLYIWDTGTNRWNFASAITLPLAWVEANADVTVGPRGGRVKQSEFGLFDVLMTPLAASYHLTPTDHLALNFSVWAPSGQYDPNRLANLSLNNWTFVPGLAYTKLFPSQNVELSAMWAVNVYTENPATDYQNGIESDLEIMAVKRFKCGAGIGVVGSWIEQLTDDAGTTADKLDGFSGRALGVGPILTYSTAVGKHHLDLNARWVHEFAVEKRLEGDLLAMSVALKF